VKSASPARWSIASARRAFVARHIPDSCPGRGFPEDREKALAKAKTPEAAQRNGADFADLAKKYFQKIRETRGPRRRTSALSPRRPWVGAFIKDAVL